MIGGSSMTTMTFDKLAYVDRLKAAGFEDDKARAWPKAST